MSDLDAGIKTRKTEVSRDFSVTLVFVLQREKRRNFVIPPFLFFCVLSAYSSAEGDGGEPCKLEALTAEWDADNCHAPQKSKHDKGKCERNAAQYKPDDVCNRVAVKICIHGCAKGPDGDTGYLQALTPEWDTDDGDAKQNSQEKPR